MQAGKVSSLSAFPFGHADISIRERSNLGKGKDVCVRSTRHGPRFPWQPEAVRAPVSKQPAGFHQCLRCGNVVWLLSIHPSLLSLCLCCLPKKAEWGRRETAVTICLFWLLAATLSMLGEQIHCGGGGGVFAQGDTADCTSFSAFGPCLFSTYLQFCPCSEHFSRFLLVKHKTLCDNISFLQELLREWIACWYSTSVPSVKAEFTFWLHSS